MYGDAGGLGAGSDDDSEKAAAVECRGATCTAAAELAVPKAPRSPTLGDAMQDMCRLVRLSKEGKLGRLPPTDMPLEQRNPGTVWWLVLWARAEVDLVGASCAPGIDVWTWNHVTRGCWGYA